MNIIISLFIRAKAWQIVVLMLMLITIVQYYFSHFINSDLTIKNDFITVIILKLLMIPPSVIFIGWLFSIGVFLNNNIEHSIKPKMLFFYIAIIIEIISYSFFINHFLQLFVYSQNIEPIYFSIMGILNFLAFFSMFYIMYFIAKNLVMAEKQHALSFQDYIKEFILLLFYAIGIWVIQPRINRLIEQEDGVPPSLR